MKHSDRGQGRPTAADRARLRDELAANTEQRRVLAASFTGRDPGDSADEADGIGRADELHRVDERIAQLHALLDGRQDTGGYLPIGTRARLRHPDGDDETVEVAHTAGQGAHGATITADSPLARAIADAPGAGEEISWHTPHSTLTATLVSLDRP